MSEQEPTLHQVTMTLCSLCLDGKGGECHVPGCALWIARAPDLSLRNNPMVAKIDGWAMCRLCGMNRASKRLARIADRAAICAGCARRSVVHLVAVALVLLMAHAVSAQEDPEAGLVDAVLTGDTATHEAALIRPQLVRRDHTTGTAIGASAAVIGGVGLVSAWALYIARANFRLTPRSVVTASTMREWTSQGAWSFWIGAGSSSLIVVSEYLLLPESAEVPTLAWMAGGGGLVLAAVGVGYAVGGTHCAPTAVRPGADILLACSSGVADALLGPLLIVSSTVLLNVPLTYLFRKAFAGAPESLSFGPSGIQLRGRF